MKALKQLCIYHRHHCNFCTSAMHWVYVSGRSHRPCDQVVTYVDVRPVEQPNCKGSQIM